MSSTKPVFSLPLAGGGTVASKSGLDDEVNRVVDQLWPMSPDGPAGVLDEVNAARALAAASAAQAALYDGPRLDTAADVLADTVMTYSAGSGQVTAGQVITTRIGGLSWAVAASDAINHDVATSGGVRLYARPMAGYLSPLQFGAVGDDSTDDLLSLQKCADRCKGVGAPGLDLGGLMWRFSAPLDLREITRIRQSGELRTTMTGAVDYVQIGTSINSNFNMNAADITLFVRNVLNGGNNNNAGLEGARGIVVRGGARAKFRLFVYNVERGVVVAPQSGQYVAFCDFTQIAVNGVREGIVFDPAGTGWANENRFIAADTYPQGNAISGGTAGVVFRGSYSCNHNVFLSLSPEGMDHPIWFESGDYNKFLAVRNEAAGPVKFGNGSAQSGGGMASPRMNTVSLTYNVGDYEWEAERPNICYSGVIGSEPWETVVNMSADDFVPNSGGSGFTAIRGINTVTGNAYFQYGTKSSANLFDPGSNNRVGYTVAARRGDIFRVHHDVGDGLAGNKAEAVRAYGAAMATLPDLTAGDVAYIGTTLTPNISGTSNLVSAITVNNPVMSSPYLVSVNRDDVQYLRFELLPGINHRSFRVERLVRNRVGAVPATDSARVLGVADFSGSLMAGQIAIGPNRRVAIGGQQGSPVHLSELPVYTAANIAAIAHAVNTSGKRAGLMVWDSTNNRAMVASGSTAAAAWYVCDGSASVTPA